MPIFPFVGLKEVTLVSLATQKWFILRPVGVAKGLGLCVYKCYDF